MTDGKLCDCGSVADWEEIGSTWICTACRDRDVRENIITFKKALTQMATAESGLRLFKVDTSRIFELMSKLKDEVRFLELREE